MTRSRSHSWGTAEMAPGCVRPSVSEVPALLPHTKLPLSGRGRPRTGSCPLSALPSRAWVGTRGHARDQQGLERPSSVPAGPCGGSRGHDIGGRRSGEVGAPPGHWDTGRGAAPGAQSAHVLGSRGLRCGDSVRGSGAAPVRRFLSRKQVPATAPLGTHQRLLKTPFPSRVIREMPTETTR